MISIKSFIHKFDKYLFLIVVLAIGLRFAGITFSPPSLNWDETSIGYNAYSILTTGKDEWGVSFPTIFRAFGDYKLPGYIYLTSISEKFFGLSIFSVRLVSVLAGIGTVIFTYFLVLELFKKRSLAATAAFLVAVEPWSLFLSRGAFEANLALFFLVSGTYFFIKSFEKTSNLIPSIILFSLSVWTYNSARVFVPILIFVLAAIYWKELVLVFRKSRKIFIASFLILAFFFIPMFIQLSQPIGQARYGKVSIIDEGAIAAINQARGSSKLTPILNRLINNKVTYFTEHFVINWTSHYSGDFLFFKGGTDYQFSVPGRGIIYFIDTIPMIVGLFYLVLRRSKSGNLLIAWFLLSPIPSAITNEAPQVLRAIVMLPIPMIITAIGMGVIADWLKKRFGLSQVITFTLYVIIIFGFLENYLTAYFTEYRTNYSWSWQYGYQQVVNYAKTNYFNYDKIIVTKAYGEPHEFFLFFWPWNPNQYRSDPNLIRFFQSDWYWVDRFDKFYFVNDWQIPHGKAIFVLESKKETVDCTNAALRCLLITSPGNYPSGWKKLDTINFLDGSPAFEMYAN
jgi:4-amino-4-deoxy-L-arabinose transferase-like glycosyltransferase